MTVGVLAVLNLLDVATVASGKAGAQLQQVVGLLGGEGVQLLLVEQEAEEEIGFQIGRRTKGAHDRCGFVRAEVARALAIEGYIGVGQHAQVVLGNGVAVAVAGAANGVGADVRNTVGGAFDGGAVRRAGVVVTASATPSNLAARHKQGGCQQAGRSGVLHSHVLLFLLVQADACAPD